MYTHEVENKGYLKEMKKKRDTLTIVLQYATTKVKF